MTEKSRYNRVAHALVQDSAMEVPEGEVSQLQVIYRYVISIYIPVCGYVG